MKKTRSKQSKKALHLKKRNSIKKKKKYTRRTRKRGGALEEDECAICLKNISDADKITTKCNHTFHNDCLSKWCETNGSLKTCPLCRADITDTCNNISVMKKMMEALGMM